MWNAGNNYSQEELEVVKELEQELFKYNLGFRAMWHDNFEEYFKGTLDEEYWNQREQQRSKELEEIVRKKMIEDFEYLKFRREMALIEDELFSDHNFSLESEMRFQERREKWKDDKLYKIAKVWSIDMLKRSCDLYERHKFIHLFRILKNCNYVASKIVYASNDYDFEDVIENFNDLAWNISWVGYTLSLTFLNRCLESLSKLENENKIIFNFGEYISTGLQIKRELMDRLETLHQKALKIYGQT
ncbi:MAG: hypothetical protein A3I07_04525 [Candidatus Doudnabacteria bacterium RIFCSPLOWO2_02_FULL_42_9]|uniref:Uncharacterized protein n=1 Tax=Candidatus Doudnabacteria bacterium RIFCSPHIGHO2_01_FULL_41_86 TaxID=1817821 RepID=A0A1F5N9B8_9BACT|nr:MAG: hypothetical protein A2717_01965 [Candidatus Doudnabacteria bacterium RIFCSPHIGHO2_01_FULL_41_86]OGE75084.1 MAG: hypothetical protein A3K07_03845 [Candidatus Doudnabacteria bacterium RIFCSPHIGHO2_01_43_10]OGE85330.1 MAG: hypothetical protein A3E28_01535 [Candidatus Doudnabacteria bacterium RIFCSPHIGHO2_12_FULL_42_22]OGE86868.1 MAG: hypothetical protein A3C49_02370 [Candidatus Doudnabacteria bacterium RIFCSPHIGHO2_02_FULL_42_25]OGE92467.1 MAG: hypothetical protein A2895_02525 [Candidatus